MPVYYSLFVCCCHLPAASPSCAAATHWTFYPTTIPDLACFPCCTFHHLPDLPCCLPSSWCALPRITCSFLLLILMWPSGYCDGLSGMLHTAILQLPCLHAPVCLCRCCGFPVLHCRICLLRGGADSFTVIPLFGFCHPSYTRPVAALLYCYAYNALPSFPLLLFYPVAFILLP